MKEFENSSVVCDFQNKMADFLNYVDNLRQLP